MEGRIGAVLKAVAIAFVALVAVDRFLPSIPLSFITHETASLPNVLKEPIQGEPSGEAFSETRRGRSFRLLPRASYDVAARVASTERYRAGSGRASTAELTAPRFFARVCPFSGSREELFGEP